MGAETRRRLKRWLPPAAALAAIVIVARLVNAAGTATLYVDDGSACSAVCGITSYDPVVICNSGCSAGCGTAAAPYRAIQSALNDADCRIEAGTVTGATVQVAAGNYPERIFIFPNEHVECEDPSTTTINAAAKGRSAVIFSRAAGHRELIDFSINRCKITGGMGENQPSPVLTVAGGGVYVHGDAVVSNNLITGNALSGSETEWIGAGVYVNYGNPLIIGNTITKNTALPPPVAGAGNSFGIGGGIFVLGPISYQTIQARIEGNLVAENLVTAEIGKAGGLRVDAYPGNIVTRNIITGNRASFAGGGLAVYGTLSVSDNLVYGNSAGTMGGGFHIYTSSAQVTNNTIFGNGLTDSRALSGYTFANYGGGICVSAIAQQTGQVRLTNNLIVGNTISAAGTGAGLYTYLSRPVVTYDDLFNNLMLKSPPVSNNVAGEYTEPDVLLMPGNISRDPLFVRVPVFSEVTVAAGTTTTVAVPLAARYSTNQAIEYNNDGIARTITAVNTTSNVLTFTPALAAASQAWKIVANWGASVPGLNVTEDFHLQSTSPGIDAGANLLDLSAYDLAGQARVADGNSDGSAVVDMGAYELVPPDSDCDGVANTLDCAPSVSSVWTPPGPVGNTLRVATGSTSPLAWNKIQQANAFNVYRGTISRPFAYNQTCLESASPDQAAEDPSVPPPGGAYFYLVSGVNSCSEGSLGQDSSGRERPNPTPCAVGAADRDGDSILDINDNCPLTSNNPGSACQLDQDRDGAGDVCDNCPAFSNPDQVDSDNNGVGDACQDSDADGYPGSQDCNDHNPAIYPGALEICNGLDDDCDGLTDENLGVTQCGTGACTRTVNACLNGVPQTCTPGTGSAETCNNIDDDCNGVVDDNIAPLTCGTGACTRTVSACLNGVPQTCTPGTGSTETCNGIDDDCDGRIDNGFDQDGDGFTTCGGDCNDLAATTYPGAPELCNGADDNCNQVVDEGYLDSDGDLMADCVDPDDDNDLVPDLLDCAPLINSVSAIPGEVGPTLGVVAGAAETTYAWTPIVQANVHDVYRSAAWNKGTTAWYEGMTCLASETTGTRITDTEAPPVGTIFFYLITGTNRCGEGSAGVSSSGQPRTIPPASHCLPAHLDTDADTVSDIDDNCPLRSNLGQADRDHDGRGDLCDNCPDAANPGQEDADGNGIGDACQP
jgi:Putative metal-binding motif/Thrombospondin type 3 repeat